MKKDLAARQGGLSGDSEGPPDFPEAKKGLEEVDRLIAWQAQRAAKAAEDRRAAGEAVKALRRVGRTQSSLVGTAARGLLLLRRKPKWGLSRFGAIVCKTSRCQKLKIPL